MPVIDSLGELPARPLPSTSRGVVGGAFVTIWAVLLPACAAYLYVRIWRREPSTWAEFRTIFYGACLLFPYYALVIIDRWMHYDGVSVLYIYVIVDPLAEISRVASTILLLWGSWSILWIERADRYSPRAQAIWSISANLAVFVVILLSLFYAALNLALSVVWLRFLNLNIIDDIATKRNSFKVAMSVGYVILGSVVFLGATDNFRKAGQVDGRGGSRRSRIPLGLAKFFLAARCLLELGLNGASQSRLHNPDNIRLSFDIAYGALTILFLFFMAVMSRTVASRSDKGGPGANRVRANVRSCILSLLQQRTENRSKPSPPLREILAETQRDMPRLFDEGHITAGAGDLSHDVARATADVYIEQLRVDRRLESLVARQDESQVPHLSDAKPPRDWRSFLSLNSHSSKLQRASVQSIGSNASGGSAHISSGNPNRRSVSSGTPPHRQDDWVRNGQQPRHFSAGDAPRMAVHREDVPTEFMDRPHRAPGVPNRTPSDATSQRQPDFAPPDPSPWSPHLRQRGEYSASIRDQMSTHGDSQRVGRQTHPFAVPPHPQRASRAAIQQLWHGQQQRAPQVPGEHYELVEAPTPPPQQQSRPTISPQQRQNYPQVPEQQVAAPPASSQPTIYRPQQTPSSQTLRPGQEYRGPRIRLPAPSQRGPPTEESQQSSR